VIFDVLDRIVGDVTVAWVITWFSDLTGQYSPCARGVAGRSYPKQKMPACDWLSSLHSRGSQKDHYEDDDENGQDEEDDGSWRLFVLIKAMNASAHRRSYLAVFSKCPT
jgi:hypothetical protein